MAERTRRASEAVDAHTSFWELCRPGSLKSQIEDGLLDVTGDPNDPRYGHGSFLYGGESFQGWLGEKVGAADTYTATTEMWNEVQLTLEMMLEEGLDWVPLREKLLPAPAGFFLAPYGIEVPRDLYVFDPDPRVETKKKFHRGKIVELRTMSDIGAGDRWFIDGFMWWVSDKVARDGIAGKPERGVTIMPLSRWRGRPEDRPYRTLSLMHDNVKIPEGFLAASDITAWAFDDEGQVSWPEMAVLVADDASAIEPHDGTKANRVVTPPDRAELERLGLTEDDLLRIETEHRAWTRLLVWSTWRWMNEELTIPERPERAVERRARKRPSFDSPRGDGSILIVDLRKERKERNEAYNAMGQPRWWRSRWVVHGHYARRRYAIRDSEGNAVGPTRGPDAREGVTFYYDHVYIEPFEKGPEWAPLVEKEHVQVLNR